jgi:hypothetical protein
VQLSAFLNLYIGYELDISDNKKSWKVPKG